jgi:hypothetical protein
MGDRPHALGGCPNTSDGRIAQLSHRAFRLASICRLQAVAGCVPQMNRGGFITGPEQIDEEGSARYRWCSSLAQSPKHPDGNAIARIARPVQHSRALLAGLLAASAAAEAAITAVVMRPIFARHADVQDDLHFRRRTQLQGGLPITIWPYSPFTDAMVGRTARDSKNRRISAMSPDAMRFPMVTTVTLTIRRQRLPDRPKSRLPAAPKATSASHASSLPLGSSSDQ